MTVYLIHFDRPYKHAAHYIGWTTSEDTLEARLEHHAKGSGARLMAVVTAAGIGWSLARVWPEGTRLFERKLKDRHKGSSVCPVCKQRVAKTQPGGSQP